MLLTTLISALLAGDEPVPVAASVLPPSRQAVVDGDPVTFFATLINSGSGPAVNCRIELDVPGAVVTYRAYDAAANAFTAAADTPVDIAAGAAQVFVLGATFSAALPRTEFEPGYVCDNAEALPVHGLTQVTLTASATVEPDVLVLASTIGTPGVNNGRLGNSVFAVSLTNLSAGPNTQIPIEISADMLDRTFKAGFEICEIDSQATCITPRSSTTRIFLTGRESRSFAIWVGGFFSWTSVFYDMVRIRARVRNFQTGAELASTSVAHESVPWRGLCIGAQPASPWSGVVRYQTASKDQGEWQIQTAVEDLNFYGNGRGEVFAVPIDRSGRRFTGIFSGGQPDELSPCSAKRGEDYRLVSAGDGDAIEEPPVEYAGRVQRSLAFIMGRDTRETSAHIIENSLRAFYTSTDARAFPIVMIPGNDVVRTPPGGIAGQYAASVIYRDGSRRPAGGWTVSEDTVSATLTYRIADEDISCTLSLDHVGLEIPFYDRPATPNPHYRLLDGTLADCTGGAGAAALEGGYHGVMIYQPLVSIGAPTENGLEVLLTPTASEANHLLWFVLQTP